MTQDGVQRSTKVEDGRTVASAHEGRIGILRRLGYASLVFWPFTFLAHQPHPEEIQQQLVITLQFGWVVVPFITARVSERSVAGWQRQEGVSRLGSGCRSSHSSVDLFHHWFRAGVGSKVYVVYWCPQRDFLKGEPIPSPSKLM